MLQFILSSGLFFWPILLLLVVPAQAAILTDGGWSADIGRDRFVFEFIEAPDGSLTGMSHSLSQGREYAQEPFRIERYEHPDLEFVMANSGVRYVGRVEADGNRIAGGLRFGKDEGMDLDLVHMDPTTEPGMAALPEELTPWNYSPPQDLQDGWAIGRASDHGLDPETLESIIGAVVDGRAGLLHSLLVIHEGTLVLEEYFHGYDASTVHPLASVTKSVSALLVGIAQGREQIRGLDTPLLEFFPGHDDLEERWQSVTLEHLLTMSIGLDWSDDEAENVHGTGPDLFERILERGFVTEPGSGFRYVNANVNLISGLIENATGSYPEQFATEHLFEPLGIDTWNWSYGAVGGHRMMDGSLHMRPRDMARIGQLMLDGGRWNDEQVIPEEFVNRTLVSQIDTGGDGAANYGYSYLWWTLGFDGSSGPLDVAFANGHGSQFIFVIPALDLVLVTTGGNQYNGMHTAPETVIGVPLLTALGAL